MVGTARNATKAGPLSGVMFLDLDLDLDLDVASGESIRALIDGVIERFGRIASTIEIEVSIV